MQVIRAFVTKTTRIANAPGTVAPSYELSPLAMTYSTTKGEYTDSLYVGDTVHTFRVANASTGANEVLSQAQVSEILKVVNLAYEYFNTHTYPFDLVDFKATMEINTSNTLGNLVHGPLNTSYAVPTLDWIGWDSLNNGGNEIRVWLRAEAFESQYSEFEIRVIPPVDDLDRFFGAYGSLAAELAAQTTIYHAERAMAVMDKDPYTYLRFNSFGYINLNNPAQVVQSVWGAIVYGANGDTIDSIKDAIVEYVLANSSYTEEQWAQVLPDIFKRTEFRMIPRWDTVSIPNLTSLAALYRAMQDPKEVIDFAKQKWNTVSASYVESNLTLFPINYKGLSIVALNGQNNAAGAETLMTVFPDYIPVSTSSVDFARMTEKTRNWLLALQEAVVAAETATEYSTLENPLRRSTRDGILYVMRHYEGVNYLIAARSNFA